MNSSGIKRGLAVSAISALALAGLSISPASAQTLDDVIPANTTNFYNPYTPGLSSLTDGADARTQLVAGSNTPFVRFEQSTDAGVTWTTITTVPVSDGLAEALWQAVPAVNRLRAVGTDATNAPLNTTPARTVAFNAANFPARVNGTSRAPLGVYFNPAGGGTYNFAVNGRGTAGATNDWVIVDPLSEGVALANATTETTGAVADGNGLFPTTGVFALTPAAAAAGGIVVEGGVDQPDDVVIGVDNLQDVSDVNVFSAYIQKVAANGATAPVAPGYSANVAGDLNAGNTALPGGGAPNGNLVDDVTRYNITVVDNTTGAPVVGVSTYESNAAGAPFDGNLRDEANVGINGATPVVTGADGIRRVSLSETTMDNAGDLNAAPNVQTNYVVIDVNGDGTYQNVGDFIIPISQTNVPAAPAAITIVNKTNGVPSVANSLVQDDDESSSATIKVVDSNGNPIQNVQPTVTVTVTTAGSPPAITNVPVGVTNAQGEVVVAIPAGVNNAKSTIKIEATTLNGVAATPATIESDQSDIVFDAGVTAQALAGTSTTQNGTIELPSGSTLPGRVFALNYTPTGDADGPGPTVIAGDSKFAPTAEQTGVVVAANGLSGIATTSATGTFAIKVTDPAPAPGAELNNNVNGASAALSSGGGDTVSTNLDLDFLRSLTPTRIDVINPDIDAPGFPNSTGDGLDSVNFGNAGIDILLPGDLARGQVRAFNADNVALDTFTANLTIAEGFFVDTTSVATAFDGTPAAGQPVNYKDAGKTKTLNVVDGTSTSDFYVNIERNAGFDDDGIVADSITATNGTLSDKQDLQWTTVGTPLNPSGTDALAVSLAAGQDSTKLPKARAGRTTVVGNPYGGTGQEVTYDVVTKDQFENPTQQGLTVTDNTPVAVVSDTDGTPATFTSEFGLGQPAIVATSPSAADQVISVELNGARKVTYTESIANGQLFVTPLNPSLITVTGLSDIEENTAAINWYNLDFAASKATITLAQAGPDSVPTGTAVSEIVKAIDQEGQPITGLPVGFLRVGPSEDGDDDGQASDFVNENGEAFYDFAGNKEGVAVTTAVIYNDALIRQYQTEADRVFFTGDEVIPPNVQNIKPTIKGSNEGNRDVLAVKAPRANGASVTLYKVRANGSRVALQDGKLSPNGVRVFRVKDVNGKNKKTRYQAFIGATGDTRGAKTRIFGLR